MRLRRFVVVAAMVPLVLLGAPKARAAPDATGVTVALGPSRQVALGATFDVYIEVTQAGSGFNGFDAVIGYDPAVLTLVSHEEGSYMTGACGNTFAVFHAGTSTDTITDVLLCGGVSLPGPGQLYRLRFQAGMTAQVTRIRFLSGLRFYNGGLYVNPVTSSDASIGVGVPLGVEPPAAAQRLTLQAAPNPSRGAVTFTVESNGAGPETLTVLDVQGRTVRRFAGDRVAPGMHTIAWDGRNEAGAKLAPGTYLARLQVASRTVWSRVTLIH
jgi:hypothetical protein